MQCKAKTLQRWACATDPSACLYAVELCGLKIRCCRWGLYIKEQPLKAFRDAVVKNIQTRFSDDTARFLFNKSESASSFTDDYVCAISRC